MKPTLDAEPDACSAVVAGQSPSQFFGWCAQLVDIVVGGRRALVAVGGDDAIERADELLSLLAHAWGTAYGAGAIDDAAWDAALAGTDTYASAEVLARSGLPAPTLARLVDHVLQGWCFGEMPCTLERHVPAGERTPEVLLGALAGSPAAARQLLAEWEFDALDLLLGWDPDAVGPLLVAAGVGADDAEAGRLLAKVMRFLYDEVDDFPVSADGSCLTDWLGAVLGRWQLHLLARSPGWEWPGLDAAEVVRWVAENETAAAALTLWWSRLTSTSTTS